MANQDNIPTARLLFIGRQARRYGAAPVARPATANLRDAADQGDAGAPGARTASAA
jgi:hypothetical protein